MEEIFSRGNYKAAAHPGDLVCSAFAPGSGFQKLAGQGLPAGLAAAIRGQPRSKPGGQPCGPPDRADRCSAAARRAARPCRFS
eukprot:scaffold161926_cov46-Prasinocladus_malaysianus.AAC.1